MVAALHLSPVTFFTLIRFQPAPLAFIVLAVAWYWRAVRRLATNATATAAATTATTTAASATATNPWPRARSAAFAGAVAICAVATLSGMDAFVRTSFAVHAIQQIGLFMLAPPLIALAAPLTLAMQSGTPERAERIRRALRSPLVKVVAHPVAAWAAFGGALFVLYFSGQYRLGVEHAWVLQLTDLELLIVGVLFAEVVVGADPKPHRMAIGWRILYLMVSTIYFSILGMAMESQPTRIAPRIAVSDLHSGGGYLWTVAELFTIAATIAVLFQWLAVDEGHARRVDRFNAEEDAAQLAAWRAARREAALADVRAGEAVVVRSRPAGSDRSDRSYGLGGALRRPDDRAPQPAAGPDAGRAAGPDAT